MFMNKNVKDKIKFRLFNASNTSKDKFFETVHVEHKSNTGNGNKLLNSTATGGRATSTGKNSKTKTEKYSKGDTGGTNVPIKVVKKYQTEQMTRMSSDVLPPRQNSSKYSINLKKTNSNQNSQHFSYGDKSLSHRIGTNGKGSNSTTNKQSSYVSMSNRNLPREIKNVNSLCSFDGSINTINTNTSLNKPNFTMEEHSVERMIKSKPSNKLVAPKKETNFRIIKDKIPYKIKEKVNNIRIYTKPQMILVEDRSETIEPEIGVVPIKLKNTTNLRKANTNFAKGNIHEVLLKNFQENVKKNKGKNILTKLKIPTNRGIFNKFSFVNNKELRERCNTLDDIIVDDTSNIKKNLNNCSLEEFLGNRAASFQESIDSKDEMKLGVTLTSNNSKDYILNNNLKTINSLNFLHPHHRNVDKHEEYKKKQEMTYSVKLPQGLNLHDKEKELDKIFSSLVLESEGDHNHLEPIEVINQEEDADEIENENETEENHENDSDKNESGVLTYDEVKDIIVHYHFKDVDVRDRNLFHRNDYDSFNTRKKQNYINQFFHLNQSDNGVLHLLDSNKSHSTKDSSSNKKNFISVIKLAE